MAATLLVPCRECGHKISRSARTCPNCGAKDPQYTRGDLRPGNIVIFVLLSAVVAWWVWPVSEEERAQREQERAEREQERAEREAEEKRKGFHCLSAWDGSHSNFKTAVKAVMREPDSFEHIETRIGPVNEDGEHVLIMEYRARNGFGGMSVGVATAVIRNSDCGVAAVTSIQ